MIHVSTHLSDNYKRHQGDVGAMFIQYGEYGSFSHYFVRRLVRLRIERGEFISVNI